MQLIILSWNKNSFLTSFKVQLVLFFLSLTVDEHHRLLDGVLVAELGVEQRAADEGAVEGGLVPAHVQMVDVDVAQGPHHLHLILDCTG